MSQLQILGVGGQYPTADPYVLFRRSEVKMKRYYHVALPSDTVVKAYTRIDIQTKPHTISLEFNGETVTLRPSDTQFISMLDDYGNEHMGIPADTCWLFGKPHNKINVYTYLPFSNWDFIAGIQKGEYGYIEPFSPGIVRDMVSDNPNAVRLWEQGETERAIHAYNGHWTPTDGRFSSKAKRGKKK
jgi:hypothetical protein